MDNTNKIESDFLLSMSIINFIFIFRGFDCVKGEANLKLWQQLKKQKKN